MYGPYTMEVVHILNWDLDEDGDGEPGKSVKNWTPLCGRQLCHVDDILRHL